MFNWHGKNYTTTGIYTDSLKTKLGCDSIVTLNLTINQGLYTTETKTACGMFNWHGKNYTTTGIYTDSLKTKLGCDSIVTLNLTINQGLYTTETKTACGMFNWHGKNYTTTGIYTDSLKTKLGCDSIVTLNLTINTAPVLSAITGVNNTTVGLSSTLANTISGTWKSSDTTIAVVSLNGVVTGKKEGVTTITFEAINNGCSAVKTIAFEVHPKIDSCQDLTLNVLKTVNDLSGDTLCSGNVQVEAKGGLAPYQYAWSNLEDKKENSAYNLCAGNYNVTVIDARNCSKMISFTLISETKENDSIICKGFIVNIDNIKHVEKDSCNGEISLSILGGQAPYTSIWNNGNKSYVNSKLCAGAYGFEIVDANGCRILKSQTIETKTPIQVDNCKDFTINILAKNDQEVENQTSCNGSLISSVFGGKAPYSYKWSTGSTDVQLINVCKGVYDLEVKDANNCILTMTKYIGRDTIIKDPCSGFFANLLAINDTDEDTICSGQLISNVGGGKGPYIYTWSTEETTKDLKGLCSGNYSLTVKDQINCSITIQKFVGYDTIYNPCKDFMAYISDEEHTGVNPLICNGSISVKAKGGKSPYNYAWNNGVKSSGLTNVCAGEYIVEVTDQNNCKSIVKGRVNVDSTKNSCNGFYVKVTKYIKDIDNDNYCTGEIHTSAIGGEAPYQFNWTNGKTDSVLMKICKGEYELKVTDANGCIAGLKRIMETDSVINLCKDFYASVAEIEDDSEDNETCKGKLKIKVNGGKGVLHYVWSDGDNKAERENLCSGNQSLIVTDENGCKTELSVSIEKKPSSKSKLKINLNTKDVSKFGECDGMVNVEVQTGNPPYKYYHSNGEVGAMRKNLCAGVYTVQVKDAKGEEMELKYIISSPLNTVAPKKTEYKDSIVKDTLKSTIKNDCSIRYNNIDSVKIKEIKNYKKDTVLVTWSVYNNGKITYVSDKYYMQKGKGVYKLTLSMYCKELKDLGNFFTASQDVYYSEELTTTGFGKEILVASLNVFPNPFTDRFTITLNKTSNYEIEVYDLSGKKLDYQEFINVNSIQMDLGYLAEGEYVLKIVDGDNVYTRLITK